MITLFNLFLYIYITVIYICILHLCTCLTRTIIIHSGSFYKGVTSLDLFSFGLFFANKLNIPLEVIIFEVKSQ